MFLGFSVFRVYGFQDLGFLGFRILGFRIFRVYGFSGLVFLGFRVFRV